MKNKKFYTAINLLLGLVMMMSCSENNKDVRGIKIPEEGLPVYATLDTRAIPAGLTCQMYVFSKLVSAAEYTYSEMIDLSGQLPYQMQFDAGEVNGKEYRFLFLAHPENNSKMSVTTASNWQGLKIATTDQLLDENYYYGILDKTGEQIATEGTIHGNLSRMVGQMVLDIYKIDGSMDNPVSIDSDKKITSILDRVHEIEIEYSNLTKEISFDADGNILESAKWDTPLKYYIRPNMGDTLQVELPQEDNGLLVSDPELKGSVRIKGICSLMSEPTVRVKYTFKYYDTTPINELYAHLHSRECYGPSVPTICGYTYYQQHTHSANCYNGDVLTCDKDEHVHTVACYAPETLPTCGFDEHVHDKDCFDDQQTIVLNLPQESEVTNLLSIIPNTYTVNKAGIRMNRVIDLNQPGSFGFNTIWENER